MKKLGIVFCLFFSFIISSLATDPLPQADVNINYIFRKYEMVFGPPTGDINTEVSFHCIFPGSDCRFTAEPSN